MGRVLTIRLSSEQQSELESYYKQSTRHVLRQRCQIILLKALNRKTADICQIVGIKSQNQVNKWIKRYKNMYPSMGIGSLSTQKGQGRKPILDPKTDRALIENVVAAERQKLTTAKVILEEELSKRFHIKTLKNFLKLLVGPINESDAASKAK